MIYHPRLGKRGQSHLRLARFRALPVATDSVAIIDPDAFPLGYFIPVQQRIERAVQ